MKIRDIITELFVKPAPWKWISLSHLDQEAKARVVLRSDTHGQQSQRSAHGGQHGSTIGMRFHVVSLVDGFWVAPQRSCKANAVYERNCILSNDFLTQLDNCFMIDFCLDRFSHGNHERPLAGAHKTENTPPVAAGGLGQPPQHAPGG